VQTVQFHPGYLVCDVLKKIASCTNSSKECLCKVSMTALNMVKTGVDTGFFKGGGCLYHEVAESMRHALFPSKKCCNLNLIENWYTRSTSNATK